MFKIELVKRGLGTRDVAEMIGMRERSFAVEFARNFPGKRTRVRVENALGVPIWTSSQGFKRRRAFVEIFGFDPELKLRGELKDFARAAGETVDRDIPHEDLVKVCWAIMERRVRRQENIK